MVERVKDLIVSLKTAKPGCKSVYVSGCRGSGKTSLQMLLAKEFQADGYEVYYFKSTGSIPPGADRAFKRLLRDSSKKVAVQIDEVDESNRGVFVELLKGLHPNLVVIGSAVPSCSTGNTVNFRRFVTMADMVLQAEDSDFQELVKYCKRCNTTSPELTEAICMDIITHCGGHAHPTLAFIEYFFETNSTYGALQAGVNVTKVMSSREEFREYFHGPEFVASALYQDVRSRCFTELREPQAVEVAFRVMSGKPSPGDIGTVTRLGWWDPDARDFISPMLKNAFLAMPKIPLKATPSW